MRLRLPLLAVVALAACHSSSAPPDPAEPSPTAPAPSLAAASPLQSCKGTGAPPVPVDPRTRHAWTTVNYPRIDVPWGIDRKAMVMLGFGGDRSEGLRFDLIVNGPGSDSGATVKQPAAGDVEVTLHTPQGMIRPSCGDATVGAWAGGSLGTSGDMIFDFPWQPNDMLEAWIQLRLPAATYWIAVPYGFTRDPREPFPERPNTLERPAAPPEAREPSRPAQILDWQRVIYDLGAVGPVEGILVALENGAEATAKVTLYKSNSGNWSLVSPSTSIELTTPGGTRVAALSTGSSRESDGMRRSDRFRFQPITEPAGRFWATLVVHVDDKEASVWVPSSVFKATHGSADGTR